MTLTDEEAERVFGGLRREFQLDLIKFKNELEFRETLEDIFRQGKLRNLGGTGKSQLRKEGEGYFPTVWRRVHGRSVERLKEKRMRPGVYVRTIRGKRILFRRWSRRDVENLRALYPRSDETAKTIAFFMDRTEKSVRKKVESLGLRKEKRSARTD